MRGCRWRGYREAFAEQGQIGKQTTGQRKDIISKTGRPLGGSCHQEQPEHSHIPQARPCATLYYPECSLAIPLHKCDPGAQRYAVRVPGHAESQDRARTEARHSLLKQCALNPAFSPNLSFLSVQWVYNSQEAV